MLNIFTEKCKLGGATLGAVLKYIGCEIMEGRTCLSLTGNHSFNAGPVLFLFLPYHQLKSPLEHVLEYYQLQQRINIVSVQLSSLLSSRSKAGGIAREI